MRYKFGAAAIGAAMLAGCTAMTPVRGAGDMAKVAATAGAARFDWFDYTGSDPVDATMKAGPNQYRNPILQGFYPDPSITRVGDDYYLVHSTFSYFPGLPVWHSRDLVNWTQIGNAIDRPDQLDFGKLGLSRGVFAPTIEFHDGTYYILNTCVDCGGNFIITATDPKGPWSDPMYLPDLEGGIDPSIFFDDDGRTWIINNGPPEGTPLYEGHRAIWIQEYSMADRKTVGPRKVLVNGGVDISKKPVWIEGPHILKKDGWYYLTCAEGGTAEGHSQVALRSRSVTGPYTPNPSNPYLTQRGLPKDRPNPITSAGHADMVQTANGEWWATFLAVRPYGDDLYNTGRETFLMPVEWVDGWPRITDPGERIPYVATRPKLRDTGAPKLPTHGAFAVREEFDATKLGPEWMMMRNPQGSWYALGGGALSLTPRPVALGDNGNPSFLGRRQQHIDASAATRVRYMPMQDGDRAGIAALQSDEYWYTLSIGRRDGQAMVLVERRAGPSEAARGSVIKAVPLTAAANAAVDLRIRVNAGRIGFDYATTPGRWTPVVENADATMLSTKIAGGFVGTTMGPFAISGQ